MISPIMRRSAVMAATGLVLVTEKEKLPIYPTAPPDIILIDAPSALEQHIGGARRQLRDAYAGTHTEVQSVVDKWIAVERKIEHRIHSLISPSEPLTPGLLYIGITTLSSSILTLHRPLPTRLLLPPLLLLSSSLYFLPRTSTNIKSYLGDLEDEYFPDLARTHEVGKAHARMAWERMGEATQEGREKVREKVEEAVGKVQDRTGLKVREAMGWGKTETESKSKSGGDKGKEE